MYSCRFQYAVNFIFMVLCIVIILIRSNEMQQYAGNYLLQNYSTCFGCLSHPSSGLHQTVTAASGTGHNVRATTFYQCSLMRTPDDGCNGHPKHVL